MIRTVHRLLFAALTDAMTSFARMCIRCAAWVCLAAALLGQATLARATEVRVGVYNNAPKIFLDGATPTGILVDLLSQIATAEQWELVYVPCEWQACLDALTAGQIDLMPDVAFSAERDNRFDFHTTPALYSWSQLYMRPDEHIASMLDLQGKRVALLEGGIQVAQFKDLVSSFGLKVNILAVSSLDDVFASVRGGHADVGVVNNRYGEFNAIKAGLVETPIVFQPARLFYATAQGKNKDLLTAIDKNLTTWQADPQSVYFDILRKWRGHADWASTPLRVWFALLGLGTLALLAVGFGAVLLRKIVLANRTAGSERVRMQAILDALPDLLFEVDLEGTYYDYHCPRSDVQDAPPAQFVGKTLDQMLPPKAAKTIHAALQVANRNGFSNGEVIEQNFPLGTRRFELSIAKKTSELGTTPRFIVLSRDITPRTDAQAALKASEETYRAIFEASPVPYMLYDAQQRILQVNAALVNCFGYDLHDLPDLDAWRNQVYPDPKYREWAITQWREHLNKFRHDGIPFEPLTLQICTKNGAQRKVIATSVATTSAVSDVYLAMFYDITDIARAEERLQNMQTMMERTEHLTRTASWEWDVDTDVVTWSPEMYRTFGSEPGSEVLRLAGQSDLYPPESVKKLLAAVQQAVSQGDAYALELDMLHADGTVRPCCIKGFPERDSTGRVVRLVGLLQDTTERKQEEEKNRLATSVFTHAREGIVITDAQANILDANASYSRITGYPRAELLGKNSRMLDGGHQSEAFYQKMWSEVVNAGFWEGELWNRRKDGSDFAVHLTTTAVRDEAGKTQNYVGIVTDITADYEHRRELEHVAYHDRLTGLPNRALLSDRLEVAMHQCLRNEQMLAVVFLDLDGFKAVNDLHGHEVGDHLLVQISNRMKNVLRESDTLSRIGGDEFVAVLTELGGVHDCEPVLARLLDAAAEPVLIDGLLLHVSGSMGVTVYPTDNVDADQLLRHADQAMYSAKQAGKNRHHFFDLAQETAVKIQREGLEYIRQALDRGEFVLHYQPKVNMKTGAVVGAEALIRWQHPQRGLLAPGQFLHLVEGQTIGIELGEWVINTALDQISAWRAAGLELTVSVNVGAQQLQHRLFVPRLEQALTAHPDVHVGQLELEILETSALEDVSQISNLMHACLDLGVRFSLDDFGTGYSSLTYLKRLPAAVLKIDQSFVRDMLTDPDDLAIVQGVIGLAGVFRREVIAEGVETAAHGAKLLELGCELAQGYGVARPMPADVFPPWVAAWRTQAQWTA